MNCSPPGSSVHGNFSARIPEWVASSFSRESSWFRDGTQVSCIVGRFFIPSEPPRSTNKRWPLSCLLGKVGPVVCWVLLVGRESLGWSREETPEPQMLSPASQPLPLHSAQFLLWRSAEQIFDKYHSEEMPNDWPGPNLNVIGSVITIKERCQGWCGKNVNNGKLRGPLEGLSMVPTAKGGPLETSRMIPLSQHWALCMVMVDAWDLPTVNETWITGSLASLWSLPTGHELIMPRRTAGACQFYFP